MNAGREMDALVAEKVMDESVPDVSPNDSWWVHLPAYSTDIAAAWLVVEKMNKPYWVEIHNTTYFDWACVINDRSDGTRLAYSRCDTAPLAICRAALMAVGEE